MVDDIWGYLYNKRVRGCIQDYFFNRESGFGKYGFAFQGKKMLILKGEQQNIP